jgi:hypothetical protein
LLRSIGESWSTTCAEAVVAVPGQGQFLGDAAATRDRSAFQHETAKSGLGEIGGGDQAVVPGTGHDDVETIGPTGVRT